MIVSLLLGWGPLEATIDLSRKKATIQEFQGISGTALLLELKFQLSKGYS